MTFTITLNSDWTRQQFSGRNGSGNDFITLNYETSEEDLFTNPEPMSVDLSHLYLHWKLWDDSDYYVGEVERVDDNEYGKEYNVNNANVYRLNDNHMESFDIC